MAYVAKIVALMSNENVSLAFPLALEVSVLSSKSRPGIKFVFVYLHALRYDTIRCDTIYLRALRS